MEIRNPKTDETEKLKALWREGFSDSDEFIDCFFSTAFSSDRCLCVADNNEVVGALYIFDCFCDGKPIAYIYAVATAKKRRGQGICKDLFNKAHIYLREKGYAGALLVPGSEELFTMYKKFGYSPCTYISEFKVVSGRDMASLQATASDEYLELRKQYLCGSFVRQEGVSPEFLSTFESFYKGEGFIFCGHTEKGVLFVREYLGDTKLCSSVVNSMKCTEGIFRTPGNDKPFSMFFPFYKESPLPSYFGFAFD